LSSVPNGLIVLKQKKTNNNDEHRSLCMDQLKLPGEAETSHEKFHELKVFFFPFGFFEKRT
jgi:hypothetical protein